MSTTNTCPACEEPQPDCCCYPPGTVTPLTSLLPGLPSVTFGARLFHAEEDLTAALRLGYVRRQGSGYSFDGYDPGTSLSVYYLIRDPLLDVDPAPMSPSYWTAWAGREEARDKWAWVLWLSYVESGGDPQADLSTTKIPSSTWLSLTFGLLVAVGQVVEHYEGLSR